jgi:hypothetical protein
VTGHQTKRSDDPDDYYAVSESEIEAWAAREHKRRQAWLEGPSEGEKQEWARLERQRRMREHQDYPEHWSLDPEIAEGRRIANRWQRDLAFALTGVAGRLVESPYRILGSLIREGREWESEHYVPKGGRRRVRLDDDD